MNNFDTHINRRGTYCIKYDAIPGDSTMLPMWIADMDFQAPDFARDALKAHVDHGIFGYHFLSDPYKAATQSWFRERFSYEIDREWIVTTHGIVTAIGMIVQGFTNEGDGVLIQTPAYTPFYNMIEFNKRKLVENPLYPENGKYYIDFLDFEKKIIDNQVKIFILCSPHNPVGRVWTKEELEKMGDICLKHKVLVVSDEIHCDLVSPDLPRKHHIFSSIKPSFEEQSIICTAPSKTFNLAGLQTSNLFIANEELRTSFIEMKDRLGFMDTTNILGLVACQASYEQGAAWVDDLNTYILKNRNYVKHYIEENIPSIKLIEAEGLFLLWLDCRGLNLDQEKLVDFFIKDANLFLNNGETYGEVGKGFMRMNIGCPLETIQEAMKRLENAVKKMQGEKDEIR